jgi:uncharacterized protein (TIGR02246 family)
MTVVDSSAEAALHDLFDRMCAAWTAGDAAAYGDCFTEDSDYVSYDGTHARGRQAMVDNHHRLFTGVLSGSALVGRVESVRHLRPGVAVLHATGSVLMPWRSSLPGRRLSRQTLVAVEEGGAWRIAALHNGRVRPVTIPGPASVPSRMSRALTAAARALGIGHAPGREAPALRVWLPVGAQIRVSRLPQPIAAVSTNRARPTTASQNRPSITAPTTETTTHTTSRNPTSRSTAHLRWSGDPVARA